MYAHDVQYVISVVIIPKNKQIGGQWPLLLTWFNFNPSMDK